MALPVARTEAASSHFLHRAFTAVRLVVEAALVWAALDLLLLLFAAVLAAQLLIGLSDAVRIDMLHVEDVLGEHTRA